MFPKHIPTSELLHKHISTSELLHFVPADQQAVMSFAAFLRYSLFNNTSPDPNFGGEKNLPPQNVSLWHGDYFRLIIFKKH